MWWHNVLVFSVLVGAAYCNWDFPPGFKFGAATAAYQIEGAWNVSGKSESVWDRFIHENPERIRDGSNGDVACDSYNQWKRDVEIASEIGVHYYRFSIAWTRLLPNGFTNYINEDGKAYYNNLIDALLEKGIEPVITLYHWDLPQSLQDLGGWSNPLIVDWFGNYARIVYSLYADRVKTWLTLNEPIVICELGVGSGEFAPGIKSSGLGSYMCNKNTMLAHAKAWRIYDEEFRPKYKGKVSLTNQIIWFEGVDESEEESAELTLQLMAGLYSHPIYSKEGGWPRGLEKFIAEKSKKEGYPESRLPAMTQEEIEFIRGTYDYYGLNYYTSRTTRKAKEGESVPVWPLKGNPECNVITSVRSNWKHAATSWFYVYPEGLRKLLGWLKKQYGDKDFFIMENGLASYETDLNDQNRVNYYKEHLEQVLLAIKEDGIRISRYTAWTMIDNFEWLDGFSVLWSRCGCLDMTFPPGFKFGAATSAYQVEGAWNASDKGESIWDKMTHDNPSLIDNMNGDVACNSYSLWRTDIHMAHNLGLHFYRFSISWSRILPTGFPNKINLDGVKYYNKLINGLLHKGVEPVITLYHFDLPQSLQNLGGWANPLISDWFADYSEIVFSLYADRVKTWITINEPLIVCDHIYNIGDLIPMVKEPVIGPYLCNKNVLLAHAKAWRIYDRKFKQKYHGKISIANNPIWLEPLSEEYEELTELARQFGAGRYSDPIYSKEGGWPPSVEKLMAEYSKMQGFPYSRLPSFSEEEKKLIQGTFDFYSLNQYTARLVRPARENEVPGPWFMYGSKELNVVLDIHPNWSSSDLKMIAVTPKGMRGQINWLKNRYNNVSILVTENGYATKDPSLYDTERCNFIRDYLKEILLAIKVDGANVIGYTVWSLMDNFEWMFGYTLKFGLYKVDFLDPLRRRTPRASSRYYANIIKHHSLDIPNSSSQRLRHKIESIDNSADINKIGWLSISLWYLFMTYMHRVMILK